VSCGVKIRSTVTVSGEDKIATIQMPFTKEVGLDALSAGVLERHS